MPLHLLDDETFRATITSPTTDVTESAEEVVDLWAYADLAIEELFPDMDWDWQVKHIQQMDGGAIQHLMVPAPKDNVYLVFVIDVREKAIIGHHLLDLGALYGVRQPPAQAPHEQSDF